jgi:hypothetical protein
MEQTVSHWPLTAEARGQVDVIFVIDKAMVEQGFIRELHLSCQYYSINYTYSSSS